MYHILVHLMIWPWGRRYFSSDKLNKKITTRFLCESIELHLCDSLLIRTLDCLGFKLRFDLYMVQYRSFEGGCLGVVFRKLVIFKIKIRIFMLVTLNLYE